MPSRVATAQPPRAGMQGANSRRRQWLVTVSAFGGFRP